MSARSNAARRGFTLVELIATLAVLGVAMLVAGVALNRAPGVPAVSARAAQVAAARARALATGRPVLAEVRDSVGLPFAIVARPDGSVIAEAALGVDRLTGRVARDAK
jgi:prepilin-type N-terminal cleavage/methylation domain-containing protein